MTIQVCSQDLCTGDFVPTRAKKQKRQKIKSKETLNYFLAKMETEITEERRYILSDTTDIDDQK